MAQKPLTCIFSIIVFASFAIFNCQSQEVTLIPTATDVYNLSYVVVDDTVTLEVTAETKGWVGFGFTNMSGMVQSDIFIGGVYDDGASYFGDYSSYQTSRPSRDDVQNWELVEASETDTTTTVKFSRLLSTGDLVDIIIDDNLMNIIWAIGETDQLLYHGFQRSSLKFNLISQTNGGEEPEPPPTPAP